MKNTLSNLYKEAKKNYEIIENTYKILEDSYELKIPIHSAGMWLLDNMYIIKEEYMAIKEDLKSIKNMKLPVIKDHEGRKYISIFFLAYELVEKNTGFLDQNIISNCLKDYQKLSYLSSEELDLFVLMLKIALLKFIARICLNIANSQIKKIQVEQILSKGFANSTFFSRKIINEVKYFDNFREYMVDTSKIKNTNTAFVEYMSYRLKELGAKGEEFFDLLKEEASKIGFTIDEAIVKEHMEIAKTTDYIGRSILSYKRLSGLNFREIFEKVNKIDETLKNEFTGEFKKCDYKTKDRYRKYIIKLSKKYNLSEVYIAKKAVECSIKYKKHVGFFLIGDDKYLLKKELNKPYLSDILNLKLLRPLKPFLYIVSILTLAFLFTYYTSFLVKDTNIYIKVLLYIILFSFGMEVSSKLIDYLLRKIVKPKTLPRFNFAKTIDKKYKTYVVMPTIISSIEKLDNMINKMEITYLANRTDNMYYMLLGDCMQSDKAKIDIDDKIVAYAKEKLDKLNEKYKSDHKIFNFIYRKRVYSKGEKSYMGWERKRGGLLQFNRLILGKMSKEEMDKTFYITYYDFVKAKYAITVDEDTEVSLNTAKDLVGIISHPLNRPVLSKNGKIVKSGYGLIQPSVGLDIEAANKTIFSKIFGGFGGLDIYTNAISNVYQDVFGEAIFCGKGIYDIELFEKLVAPEIPENLVLSHDLLEGSIIRAGLASDVELQDGFPSNYIAYMKRNHRWFRGDMQIIKWLISPKSKLNLLSKWKIFDNLRRPMVYVFALIFLVILAFLDLKLFQIGTLLTFVVIGIPNILSIIDQLIFGKIKYTKDVQYIPIINGIKSDLLKMCFNFATIPYQAYICISAFTLSLYRMLISKSNLLEWTTGEMLDKKAKSNFSYYFINMFISVIYGLLLIFIKSNGILFLGTEFKFYIGLVFIISPFFAYLLGKDHLIYLDKKLDKKQNDEILEVARRTWFFFDTMMNEANNYLPTDNYQENRRVKVVNRTSSTNIGFAILSIINAYDLKFISLDECLIKLTRVFNTIEKLEKWNGHLYNWYNIKTLEPLRPRFVSTVDSGNFVSCLYVAREFLKEFSDYNYSIKILENNNDTKTIKSLIDTIDLLIKNTDFSYLYDATRNLFTIGYDQESSKLSDSYYDLLMSESRTTSLIAIARRQVTSKHWFTFGRNLVKLDGYKGLVSWTGTAFEYFMPYIFLKSYPHTLIDQTLFFAKYSQIKYAQNNNVAWGISESGFAVKDNELNYQYQAFGIPWLGLKRGLNDYLVISPYSSLLMIEYAPDEVYRNMKRLKKLGMYSSYGFYEAVDYTKAHIDANSNFEIVKTYMAHHQGMILASINNYINHGIIKNRFHKSPDIQACEILLKERERLKASIKKKTHDKENVFRQKNIQKYTTYINYTYGERTLNKITGKYTVKKQNEEAITFLKGGKLSTMLTNTGANFLKYKDKILNRQLYNEVNTTGNFVYLTDMETSNIISVTDCDINSKNNKNSKKCLYTATLSGVEYYIENSKLEVTTKLSLSPEYNAEMKKISIYNNSNIKREIIINTYIEPALTDYMTNVVHPSFSNLQMETYYDENLDTLIATKRTKTDDEQKYYIYSKLVGIDLEKDVETEKVKLVKEFDKAYDGEISNYPLWPVLSYRAKIILDPHERQEFYYIVGIAESKYDLNNAIVNLDKSGIESQYKIESELSSITARYLKLEKNKAQIYNNIIKDVVLNKNPNSNEAFWNSNLSQSLLWKYSISGDLPVILVYINKIEDAGIINEIINFMDYIKNRGLDIDIVIIIDEKDPKGSIYNYLKTRIDRAVYMDHTKGDIYLLNMYALSQDEIKLLSFLARRYINSIDEFLSVEESKEDKDVFMVDKNENMKEDTIDEK